MPRSRGGAGPSRAPARPAAAPPRPTAPQQQTRPASTVAHPPQNAAGAQAQQGQQGRAGGSGLFGQMASTAAGVAVGSSIGHALGGFFGGGSSAQEAVPAEQGLAQDPYAMTSTSQSQQNQMCAAQVGNFRQCMDQNQGDLNICGWYLDQLKACQQAASQY